jgi:hypothetical protein
MTTESAPLWGKAEKLSSDSHRGPYRIGRSGIPPRISAAKRRLVWWLNLSRCIWVWKIRALILRISCRVQKRLDTNGVDLKTLYCVLPTGRLVLNRRGQIRTHDMQCWLATFPTATLADLQRFLAGWDKAEGSLSAAHNMTCTSLPAQKLS